MNKAAGILIGLVVLGAVGAGAWFQFLRDDGVETVFASAAATSPEFEPADAPGSDAFFPLDEQLDMVAMEAMGIEMVAFEPDNPGSDTASMRSIIPAEESDVALPTAAELQAARPSDADVATGLYGGTAENTCDPERLISYLLDNPDKGLAWAAVQGITFAEMPGYIRSLTPMVLASDYEAINHGYDEYGNYAKPIPTVLEAGTAVLVDDKGDVRARCYCGNPIVPPTPPSRCIEHVAHVYADPAERKKVLDAPLQVYATGQTATAGDLLLEEVSWSEGATTATGWVQSGHLAKRYCKLKLPTACSDPDVPVYGRADDSTPSIGTLDHAIVDVLVETSDNWTAVRYGRGTGWTRSAHLDNDACSIEPLCISTTGGIIDGRGWAIDVAPRVTAHHTGKIRGGDVGHAEVYLSDGSGRIGWIEPTYEEYPVDECEPAVYCTVNDYVADVYDEPDGSEPKGHVTHAALSGTVSNGWLSFGFGPGTGWVPVEYLRGEGCDIWTKCVVIVDGYYSEPILTSTKTSPSGAQTVGITGVVYGTGEPADYWVELDGKWVPHPNLVLVDYGKCNLTPTPPPPPPAVPTVTPTPTEVPPPPIAPPPPVIATVTATPTAVPPPPPPPAPPAPPPIAPPPPAVATVTATPTPTEVPAPPPPPPPAAAATPTPTPTEVPAPPPPPPPPPAPPVDPPCAMGEVVNGQCVCPAGYVNGGGGCIPDCPAGYVPTANDCVCPAGTLETKEGCEAPSARARGLNV